MAAKRRKKQAPLETPGHRLARFRRQRGLSQSELASQLGLTQRIVSDYERGRIRLHAEVIIQLSDILKVSADELLGLRQRQGDGQVLNRRFLRRLKEVDRLARRDQEALLKTIDAYLLKLR